jgi:two-component system sensor histidine kinase QseC
MKSLRRQLTRELLLALALLLGAALLLIYGVMWVQLNRAFNSALEARALGISALVEQEAGRVQVDFSEKLLRGFNTEKARRYFELRDPRGALIARSPSLQDKRMNPPPGPATETPVYWDLALPNGRDGRAVRFLFQPKSASERPAGGRVVAELIVAVDREDLDENLGGLFFAVAGCGGLVFLAVLWVVPRVLRRGLAPVDRLGEQVTRIDAGSLSGRLEAESLPVELRPITGRLNDLLARLETSFERERRFSADLAHELRTPLAELRSLAECALKWPEARDPATDRDTLAIALQMEALVTRLLTLARGERGQVAAQPEPVELAPFVAAAWQPFAARAAARALRVRLAVAPGAAAADPVLLRSILANLFDNAVDYTPAGGEISVTGEAAGGLRLANPAGNLTTEDAARLFDRFWRKEAARSGGEHAGLGLSLARTFAAAMGWRLSAALEGSELVFRLAPARAGELRGL